MLWGRAAECALLDEGVGALTAGRAFKLALRGEAGIGKTALLDHAERRAEGALVLRTGGVESESELVYGGLLALLRPMLGLVDELPPNQAAALRAAFALGPPVGAERFAVAAATLSLVSIAAEERPVLCLVDDLHWLDAASIEAVLFTARRLGDEGVGVIVALRDGERSPDLRGIEEVRLHGLDLPAADELLRGEDVPVAATALAALVDATHGNPLALREIARTLTPAQRAGHAPLGATLPVGPALEAAFGRRLRALPEATREAMVLLAAEPSASSSEIAAALATLGSSTSVLDPAVDAGLLATGGEGPRFVHPVIRSVAFSSASSAERRRLHGALAATLAEDERRAWHLAEASRPPDDTVATALHEAGQAAAARGDMTTAAHAFERSADFTESPDTRAGRLLQAAQLSVGGGGLPLHLLDRIAAERVPSDIKDDGRILRAMLGASAGHLTLLDAAMADIDEVRARDPGRAALLLSFAATAGFQAFDMEGAGPLAIEAYALADASPVEHHPLGIFPAIAYHQYLYFARPGTGPDFCSVGLELLERVEAGGLPDIAVPLMYSLVWSDHGDAVVGPLDRLTDQARRAGALLRLAWLLSVRSDLELAAGDILAAERSALEGLDVARVTGVPLPQFRNAEQAALCATLRGDEDAASELLRGTVPFDAAGHEGVAHLRNLYAGLVDVHAGRLEEAAARLAPEADFVRGRGGRCIGWFPAQPELVEVLVRLGDTEGARRRLDEFAGEMMRVGVASERALVARCAALLCEETEIDEAFAVAHALHAQSPSALQAARTRLLHGERLRRARRPVEARGHLTEALTVFERLGAVPLAERTRNELAAAGAPARRPDRVRHPSLTPQELQVAREVATGKTNREVAAALFLSPKTVEMHLGRVFRKSGVRSRAELARRVAEQGLDALADGAPGISP